MTELAKARCNVATTQLADKQKELADYQAETIKVIRGESRLDIDLLNDLVSKAKQEIQTLTATVDVYRDYTLEIEFNVSFEDFRTMATECQEQGYNKPPVVYVTA